MLDPRRPISCIWFAMGAWATPERPNGYFWPEDDPDAFAKSFLAYCDYCAEVNASMRSQACVWWNVEGERKSGWPGRNSQPDWAYVGDYRKSPIPYNVLQEGMHAFFRRGIRVFATVRHSRAFIDPTGRVHRHYGVNPTEVLAELFDAMEGAGFSGAYFDSPALPGRRLWRPLTMRARATSWQPPLVSGGQIRAALKSIDLGPELNPWGGGGFDVFVEYGDQSHDEQGFGIYTEGSMGDMRFRYPVSPADGSARKPEDVDQFAIQMTYRKRYPKAYRVLAMSNDVLTDPAREREILESMRTGNIVMFSGSTPIDRPDLGATWRVWDFYSKVHEYPPRPETELRRPGTASAAPGPFDEIGRERFHVPSLSAPITPSAAFAPKE